MATSISERPTFFTGRIAQLSGRRRRLFFIGGVLLLALAVFSLTLGTDTDLKGGGIGESREAGLLFDERFETNSGGPTEILVFDHETLTVDDPQYRSVVEGLIEELSDVRTGQIADLGTTNVFTSSRVVASAVTHWDTGAPREASPFVAQNASGGDVSIAILNLEGRVVGSEAASVPAPINGIETVVSRVGEWQSANPGFLINIGGDASVSRQMDTVVDEDFGIASIINIPVTIIIMIIATGAILAALLPIVLAFIGIFISMGVLALVSQVLPLEAIYVQVVLLMGLAAGIDYALFLVMRYRSERAEDTPAQAFTHSLSRPDSIVKGWSNTGRNVFIAATTTVVAIVGMVFVGDPVFTSLGVAAIVTIIVAWIVSTVFLPALTGDALRRFNIPWVGKYHMAGVNSFISPVAERVVKFSWAHPVPVTIAAAGFMLVISIPLFTLNLAFNGAAALPDDVEAKAAFVAIEENFTLGLSSPARVMVDAGKNENIFDPAIQDGIERLRTAAINENRRAASAGEHEPFGLPIDVEFNDAGDTALVNVPLNADLGEQRAFDAIELLRGELVPNAFNGTPIQDVFVGGSSAGNLDFRDNIISRAPIVLGFVVVTAFFTLLVMYRSVVISVLGILLNGLAVAASYGLLVLVFQEGYALEGLLNFEATGIIESWLPLFVFSILFGISMDYITFAIGRMKELHDEGMETGDAILEGVRGGFGTVFSAAAIMIAVAAIFAFMRVVGIQQFGFALAIAVFFDATLILAVLLPASARLMGEKLWWMPSWLEWIPGGSSNERVPKGAATPSPT